MKTPEMIEAILALNTLTAAMAAQIATLESEVAELKTKGRGGPKSERPMTEADAYRVKFGDLKDMKHKEAAEAAGLSYGQVFSCRGSYTFKHVRENWKPTAGPEAAAKDAS